MNKTILSMLMAAAFCVGCMTKDPATGQKVYDPVKTEQVKEASKTLIASATRRTIVDTYGYDKRVLLYFEKSLTTFKTMRDNREFSVATLRLNLEAALYETGIFPNPDIDGLIIDGKNFLISLYAIQYENRLSSDLSEEGFLFNLIDALCNGTEQGINDAKLQLGL